MRAASGESERKQRTEGHGKCCAGHGRHAVCPVDCMTTLARLHQRQQRQLRRQRTHAQNAKANVHVQRDLGTEPRLPHERDESADSANTRNDDQRTLAHQAAADVARGIVDTDVGPPLRIAGERLTGAPDDSPAVDDAAARQTLPQEPPSTGKTREPGSRS